MRSRGRRVLGLAVVAVLVMSVVGLAATQTFINKTGKTVIGIKITFSKSVRITRHDSALPDQSPNEPLYQPKPDEQERADYILAAMNNPAASGRGIKSHCEQSAPRGGESTPAGD